MSIWKLYWVASDGFEDCFVVAKNSRSAARIEVEMNGFSHKDIVVTRVMDIPDKYEEQARKTYKREQKKYKDTDNKDTPVWPGYAHKWLLKVLGARFRTLEDKNQTLINSVVYSCGCEPYPIGFAAVVQMSPELNLPKKIVDEETADYGSNLHTALGLALERCHIVESALSKSFIFAVSEKQKKKKNVTIKEFIKTLEKKTLGGLLAIIEEGFEIQDDVKNLLHLFLSMRNKLVHGITQTDRYDIDDYWGQRELFAFIHLFLIVCEPVLEIAKSCCNFSLYYAENYLIKGKKRKFPFEIEEDSLAFFASYFKVKV